VDNILLWHINRNSSDNPLKFRRMVSSGLLRLVALVRATRRNNPEDTILHSHRRENLKSYALKFNLSSLVHMEILLPKKQYFRGIHSNTSTWHRILQFKHRIEFTHSISNCKLRNHIIECMQILTFWQSVRWLIDINRKRPENVRCFHEYVRNHDKQLDEEQDNDICSDSCSTQEIHRLILTKF
jgi:hypothetical protein